SPSGGNYNQNPYTSEFFLNNVTMTGSNLTTKWLEELYFINPKSKFNIMLGDNRTNFTNSLINSSIPFQNLKFVFYTDGSGTASKTNDFYSDQASFDNLYNVVINQVLTKQTQFTIAHVLAASKLP